MENIIQTTISDCKIIGIGTGKTVSRLIDYLPNDRIYIPSSFERMQLLSKRGLSILPLASASKVDIYYDSADFYDKEHNLLKGGGASLVQEKILMSMADKNIIIVQNDKYKSSFEGCRVSICILPDSIGFISHKLDDMNVKYAIRNTPFKAGPLVTDLNHYIIDIEFNLDYIEDIKDLPGVVEHGYFGKTKFNQKLYEI